MSHASDIRATVATPADPASPLAGLDVLIVDDADEDRMLFARLARAGGAACVREAALLSEARAEVERRPPDVMLLDNRLSDGTAADLLQELSEDRSSRGNYPGTVICPVVVLTSEGDPRLAADIVRRGAGDYLPKGDLTIGDSRSTSEARHALAESVRRAREHHSLSRRAARLLASAMRKRERAQQAKSAERAARRDADLVTKRLQSALDAGGMGTWVWDLDSGRATLDERDQRIFGVAGPEADVKELLGLLDPEDAARVEAALRAVVEGRALAFQEEFRVRRPSDGQTRWLAGVGRVVEGDKATRRQMYGVNWDVTDRHQATQALRRSERENVRQFAELSAIYETAPVGLGLLDARLAFTSANEALVRLLGLADAGPVVGRPAAEVLPSDLWRQVEAACRRALHDSERQRLKVRLVRPAGDNGEEGDGDLSLLFACGPIGGRAGGSGDDALPIGVNLVLQDVTDLQRNEEQLSRQAEELRRQQAELARRNDQLEASNQRVSRVNKALAETSGRLEAMLRGAPVGFGFFDASGRFVQLNGELARLLGVGPDEPLGEPVDRVVPDLGKHLRPYLDRVFETGHPVIGVEVEGHTRLRTPTARWFLVSFFPVHGNDGTRLRHEGDVDAVGCVMLDITDRKRGERLLREAKENAINARISADRARELAERANKAKSEFLAVLSHELRTPLTPVLAGTQMLEQAMNEEPLGSLTDDFRDLLSESLSTIHRNVELEVRLIDDLLDLTRITRGKLQLARKPIDLNEAVRHAVETCRGEAEQKDVRLAVELAAGPLGTVADSARIQQVVWNLVKNAVKFTPEGGQVTVETRSGGDASGPKVVCLVSDTGLGIDREHLRSIFNAFEQGGRGTTRTFGGLGLGLAISRYLVDAHGGTLTAQSEGAGHGSTFTMSLPAKLLRKPAAKVPDASGGDAGAVGRVLLVEDHDDTSRLMARFLKVRLKADVTRAANVADGRARYAEAGVNGAGPFKLIISDIGLPDGSGVDFLRSLPDDHPPAIALSGYGTEADVQRSREAGFAEHLVKPIDLDRLDQTVRKLLSR